MTKKEIAVLDAIKASIRTTLAAKHEVRKGLEAYAATLVREIAEHTTEIRFFGIYGAETMSAELLTELLLRCNSEGVKLDTLDHSRLLQTLISIKGLRFEALELQSVVDSFESLNGGR